MTTKALADIREMTRGKLTLGKAVWAIRKCEELSQTEFAKKLNVSRQYLCDLEHDRKAISARKAHEFAKKLGHSSEQFIALAIQNSLNLEGFQIEVSLKPLISNTKLNQKSCEI